MLLIYSIVKKDSKLKMNNIEVNKFFKKCLKNRSTIQEVELLNVFLFILTLFIDTQK